MDTTIWHVRPKQETDSRVELWFCSPRSVDAALYAEPIQVKGNAILHLSDLHFAPREGPLRKHHVWGLYEDSKDPKMPKLAESIRQALKDRKIGLIIVSGDLTFMASPAEFEEATKALMSILRDLDLSPDQLLVIPGNHDIKWTKGEEAYQDNAEIENASDQACKAYAAFFKNLYRLEPNDYYSMARRYVFPHGGLVDVVGLNSSSLEQGRDFLAGMGKIHENAFEEASGVLDWGEPSHALRLLVQHHHLTATDDVMNPNEYKSGFGMAIDATNTLRNAAIKGVHLALHGHRHRPFVWRSAVYGPPEESNKDWKLGHVSILGGGSAGSIDVVDHKNYFNLITLHAHQLEVELFRSRATGSFQCINHWSASLTLESGKLQLGDWDEAREN